MKLPAVAIAAPFAGGILLGLHAHSGTHATSRLFLAGALLGILAAIFLGILLNRRENTWLPAGCALLAWTSLGVIAAILALQPLPRTHILQRIARQEISLKTPLRWHGRLRSDPSRQPWGFGLEMNLDGVDTADGFLPVVGGMRLSFTPTEMDPSLPDVSAGDEIAALAQGRLPLQYKDAGAFDRREYLAQQEIHLLATLRASALLERTASPPSTLNDRLSRLRTRLRNQVDALFPSSPGTAGILRAMLLGDRSFLDRTESVDYQKTGVFHVLVVAGLHVGALSFFLFWITRRLRVPPALATLLILLTLFAYIAVVEQRAPVLRAGLMAAIVVLGSYFFRRLDLLNSAAVAALLLLIAKPHSLLDTSFQLSFLAIGCIAGLAMPWMEQHLQPRVRALRGWRDFTRDASFTPEMVQYRLDLRDAARALTARLSSASALRVQDISMKCLGWSFRTGELFALSFVLQLGMLPLMARDFHRVALLGPMVNLAAVPLTGFIVPLGFFSLALSLIFPPLARAMALPLSWLVALQGQIVSWFARIPDGSYRIPGPPTWLISLFFVAAIALAAALRSRTSSGRRFSHIFAAPLFLSALLIALHPFPPSKVPHSLEVTVLDVAQGDSILVVSPKGSTLLIDGGGAFQGFRGREERAGMDPGEDVVSPYLWSRGIQRLDAAALTHAHQDHIGGLPAILQNFRVGQLWIGRETATPALARLKEVAARLHVPIKHEIRGQRFMWDGVEVEFFWPEISPEEIAPSAKNNDSLVVRLRYAERSILLPGDAEKQVEYAMLAENDAGALRADVLKVGHHGSKNSTMPDFLAAVAPQIAIISAGEENPYGHPSPELLQRLVESGSRTLRTDQQGAVQILTDGHDLRVHCFVECREAAAESGRVQTPDHNQPD